MFPVCHPICHVLLRSFFSLTCLVIRLASIVCWSEEERTVFRLRHLMKMLLPQYPNLYVFSDFEADLRKFEFSLGKKVSNCVDFGQCVLFWNQIAKIFGCVLQRWLKSFCLREASDWFTNCQDNSSPCCFPQISAQTWQMPRALPKSFSSWLTFSVKQGIRFLMRTPHVHTFFALIELSCLVCHDCKSSLHRSSGQIAWEALF